MTIQIDKYLTKINNEHCLKYSKLPELRVKLRKKFYKIDQFMQNQPKINNQRSVSTKDIPPLARPPTVPLSQQPVMHLQHHSTATTSPASIQLVQQYPWSFQTQPSTIHDPVLINQQAAMYSQHRSTATTSPSSIQLAQ